MYLGWVGVNLGAVWRTWFWRSDLSRCP